MTDSVFGNPETGTQPNTPEQGVPAKPASQETGLTDLLSTIKTPDGRQKYADIGTALESIPHAQNDILELSTRVRELEEQLTKSKTMEQVLEQLQAPRSSSEQPSVAGLTEAQIKELFNKEIQEREAALTAKANEAQVTKALRERYGDKAGDVLAAKADELGVDIGFLQSLAQRSPKAVLNYFGGSTQPTPSATSPGYNTAAFNTPKQGDPLAEARAKLFGQGDSLKDKWRAAALN